ncbi:MAG: hypothetical protein U0871_25250 [Gemmataceae bacterium]
MSSGGFETIFERAADIVRIRCGGMEGLEAVLGAIRGRIKQGGGSDPRVNRDLFFEPWLDAQQLRVPEETAEEVARQLLELTVLRLWTRVKCPEAPAGEDGVMFETDSDKEFQRAIEQMCSHCGTAHDLVPSLIESVYAPNFPGPQGVMRFDYDKLKPAPAVVAKRATGEGHVERCENIAQVQVRDGHAVLRVVTLALGHNTLPEDVPRPTDAWWHVWLGPLIIVALYLLLIIPITVWAGNVLAVLVSCVVLAVIYLVMNGHVKAKLAPSALQRQTSRWGFYLSIAMITAGTTGVEFSAKDGNRLTIPTGENSRITLPLKFEYGAVEPWLVGAGVVCFLGTLVFVYYHDKHIGWHRIDAKREMRP